MYLLSLRNWIFFPWRIFWNIFYQSLFLLLFLNDFIYNCTFYLITYLFKYKLIKRSLLLKINTLYIFEKSVIFIEFGILISNLYSFIIWEFLFFFYDISVSSISSEQWLNLINSISLFYENLLLLESSLSENTIILSSFYSVIISLSLIPWI